MSFDLRIFSTSLVSLSFSTLHGIFAASWPALKSKNKDWLAQSEANVFEWRDMSTRGPAMKRLGGETCIPVDQQ